MCMRVVERYAVCKCVYFTHGVDQCGAYGRRGHMVQDKVILVGHTCPAHSNMGFASYGDPEAQDPRSGSHIAPAMLSSFAAERRQPQQQQQQQREAPAEPAVEALQRQEEAARVRRNRRGEQEEEGRAKKGLLLTEGNISFYWRNYA